MPVTYAQDPQFADFLLSNTQSEAFNRYLEEQNIPFQDINPLYKQIWFPLDRLSDNLLNDTIYTSIPKLYIPQSLTALENTGILPVQQRVSLALTGKNILIGFLDSGISYTQPAFLDTAGRTRIDGEKAVVTVSTVTPLTSDKALFQRHDNHITLETDLDGSELFEVSLAELTPTKPTDEATDTTVGTAGTSIAGMLCEGRFALYLAGEPYKSGLKAQGCGKLKKAVFSIELDPDEEETEE